MTRILGIGGSRRTGSGTLQALSIALAGAQEAGAEVALLNLATLNLPVFDGTYDLGGYAVADQRSIQTLLNEVDAAQGIILASPTYHGTISSIVKNALELLEIGREDMASRFTGKAVGTLTVQGGTSGTGNNTLTTMLLACRAMGGWVTPTAVSIPGSRTAFDESGMPNNPAVLHRLKYMGAEVVQTASMLAVHWQTA